MDLRQATGSQRQALGLAGVSRSTWQYRQKPRPKTTTPIPHAQRAYPWRVSDKDRERIEEYILTGWANKVSVDHSFASAWDQEVMLGSRRTWWRIAKDGDDPRVVDTLRLTHNGSENASITYAEERLHRPVQG